MTDKDEAFEEGMKKFDADFFKGLQKFYPSSSSVADIYVFNPNTRRGSARAKEERGGGRRNKTRGKRAK